MPDLSDQKYQQLKNLLQEMTEVLVAFSGGVDSTLLLYAAREALKDKVTAVTERSLLVSASELDNARKLAAMLNIKHLVIKSNPFSNRKLIKNTRNRCYWCKRDLFKELNALKNGQARLPIGGQATVVDGTNYDDFTDFRPGIRAARVAGVRHPLAEAKLTKKEIRILARRFGLPNADKPSEACLASRIPYGVAITTKLLRMIEKGESYLRNLGLEQVRLRLHDGKYARIEVSKKSIPLLLSHSEDVVKKLQKLGFTYITLDLQGYRTGSMNEKRT